MSDERPYLERIARYLGIESEYVDQLGNPRHASTETRARLVSAMGFDVATEESAAAALRGLKRAHRRRIIAPVRVVRQASRSVARVTVRVPAMAVSVVQWQVTLRTEEGTTARWSGAMDGGPARKHSFDLPVELPLGYHDLEVCFEGGPKRRSGSQRLIVVPPQCAQPEARLAGRRAFGITTNLYTVRSGANWGVGDIGDVKTIARWLGQHGGAFVGMNPMHALRNEGYDVSPYSPITRLFRNPIYLRVEDIPEFTTEPAARALVAAPAFQAEVHELRAAHMLDNARVMALRMPVLETLHRSFLRDELPAGTPRAKAYAAYVSREDPALTLFATYMTIAETEGPDARAWPLPMRDAHGEPVASLRHDRADRVDFHRWLQFELDRQLGVAATDAVEAGLTLGMYQDLAVGSAASGSDVWAYPELFRQGATVGAPPDMYSDEGQNWGLPAIDPRVLRATGYDYWIRILRAGFRHTGALRIDHALGLFRMFWVPLGESARKGAYVRSFTHELFGILALESVRHNALVVGEDLGTIPPHVPAVLHKWGVLSSKVQVFERDFHSGRFRPASEYPRLALATVNTHDLPPLAGRAEARDIMLRTEVGDLSDPGAASQMLDARRRDLGALIESLIDAGLLAPDAVEHFGSEAFIEAVHTFVRRTPSVLVGLSLDDLALESTPVNIPGVWQDRYPSWSRRMRDTLDALLSDPRTARMLGIGAS